VAPAPIAAGFCFFWILNSSGNFATFAALRRASSRVGGRILFDDLVGSNEHSRRDFEAKRLRGLLVDP